MPAIAAIRSGIYQNWSDANSEANTAAVAVEQEAQASDRKNRESEARQHPMIKKAQDVFGVSLKEIKT